MISILLSPSGFLYRNFMVANSFPKLFPVSVFGVFQIYIFRRKFIFCACRYNFVESSNLMSCTNFSGIYSVIHKVFIFQQSVFISNQSVCLYILWVEFYLDFTSLAIVYIVPANSFTRNLLASCRLSIYA